MRNMPKYKQKFLVDRIKLKKLRKKKFPTQIHFVDYVNQVQKQKLKDDPLIDWTLSLGLYKQIEATNGKLVKDVVLQEIASVLECDLEDLIMKDIDLEPVVQRYDLIEQVVHDCFARENDIVATLIEAVLEIVISVKEQVEKQNRTIEKQKNEIKRLSTNINIAMNKKNKAIATDDTDDSEMISIPKEDIIKYLLKNNKINISHNS